MDNGTYAYPQDPGDYGSIPDATADSPWALYINVDGPMPWPAPNYQVGYIATSIIKRVTYGTQEYWDNP
jgi:hypothetical protein